MGPRLPRLPATAARRAELVLLTVFWLLDVTGLSAPRSEATSWGTRVPGWLGGALVTLTYVAVLARYRRPLAVLVGLGVSTIALPALLPDVHSFPPLLFALNAVASRLPRRTAVLALIGTIVPMGALVAHDLRGSSDPKGFAPFTVVLYLIMVGAAWSLGVFAAETRARRAQAAAEAANAAVSVERLRVARELHDIVAHAVSVMVVQAAGAQRVVQTDPSRAAQALAHIETAGKESMEELRRMLGALRSTADDGGLLVGHSLADLPALAAQVRAAGTDVVLTEDGPPGQLAPSVTLAAYRVVQEALTNTTRHAGVGASATVRLHWAPQWLQITVDDVRGATPRVGLGLLSTGHGLLGLRERVELVGGRLSSGPTATGFRLQAELPTTELPGPVPAPPGPSTGSTGAGSTSAGSTGAEPAATGGPDLTRADVPAEAAGPRSGSGT